MKNRGNRWELIRDRLKEMRLHYPPRFWVGAGLALLFLNVSMAVRTMQHGIGTPVSGVIRAAPLVVRRGEGSMDSPGAGPEALRNRAAARRSLAAVKNWEQWMDSLRQTVGGAAIYDSILLSRPGLLDTAKEVEEYYWKQLK